MYTGMISCLVRISRLYLVYRNSEEVFLYETNSYCTLVHSN